MPRVGCIYTVERGATGDKPLPCALDIPFGMAVIATILKNAGNDVGLFVFSPRSDVREQLARYVLESRPRLVCLTAVSSQFAFVCRIADIVKELDPSIFVILGGHHASLDAEQAIRTPSLDAICVGEGDHSILPLVECLEAGRPVTNIPHLWIKLSDGEVERNPPLPFEQNLDALPHIDRSMWDVWVNEPWKYPSVLLGRGCPFRCTYCSSHAMQRLSSGRFVRMRSPDDVVAEIDEICTVYPTVKSIYLEVETIAHQREAGPLFQRIREFNAARPDPIAFGLNFTVTSTFIRDEDTSRGFLDMLASAGVTYLNVGLESGSEVLRRDTLRRPRYTNQEFRSFAHLAREYGIALDLYVLIGVPGETLDHYTETVELVRAVRPKMVFLSIFYPYLGTDLFRVAADMGLLSAEDLDPTAERSRAALDLPGFSRRRVRLEYVLFWFRVYRGVWSTRRILTAMGKGFVNGSPRLWPAYMWLRDRCRSLLPRRKASIPERGHVHRPSPIDFTHVG